MSNQRRQTVVNRRNFVRIAGVSGAIALAGCTGGSDGGSNSSSNGGGSNGSGSSGGSNDSGSSGESNGSSSSSGSNNNSSGGTAGKAGSGGSNQVIIGSNHPLSGSLASTGTKMDNAIKLAAKRKNDAGGISSLDGATVKVVSGDNKGDQSLGGQVTNQLIDEGATVLTGCYASPVTTAATQAAERQQTPFVVSIAADDAVLQGRKLNYSYRPQPPAKKMAEDYANLVPKLVRNSGGDLQSAGLFYVNNSYGQAIRDSLKASLPKKNVELVTTTAVELGANSADTQVTKLKQADPDTVIATTYVPGGVLLTQAMQNQNYQPKYLTACASATFLDDDALSDIGSFANGVLDNNYALNGTIKKTKEVRKQFESQYGNSMDGSTGMAYVATEVILAAIEKAGSADAKAINDALKKITVTDHIGAMGPIEFKSNGENKNALAPVSEVQNLTAKVVYPKKFATSKPQL